MGREFLFCLSRYRGGILWRSETLRFRGTQRDRAEFCSLPNTSYVQHHVNGYITILCSLTLGIRHHA
jgi:hypothetical protein